MMTAFLAIAVFIGLIASYAFGEWVGTERERIRQQRRKANVLDFTPRLRRLK